MGIINQLKEKNKEINDLLSKLENQTIPFIWNGKELNTCGDIMDAVYEIHELGDKNLAQIFMNNYRYICDHADENISYMAGYSDRETAISIRKMFVKKGE